MLERLWETPRWAIKAALVAIFVVTGLVSAQVAYAGDVGDFIGRRVTSVDVVIEGVEASATADFSLNSFVSRSAVLMSSRRGAEKTTRTFLSSA